MKKIITVIACIAVIACSKKTIPTAKTKAASPGAEIHLGSNTVHRDTAASAAIDTAATIATNTNAASVLVISDGSGRILTSQENLPPDADIKFNNLQLSKGFTPQQRVNLTTRYKMIPPRVLYVAKQYQLNSLRGTYYIYKKKFWYWKKKDGLFYLDEKYYL